MKLPSPGGPAARRPFPGFLLLLALVLAVLTLRLYHLQFVRGDYFRSISTRNHIRVIYRPAPRGIIRDRNGIAVVDNVPSLMVSVVPSEFDTLDAPFLAGLLGMPPDTLSGMLAEAASRPFRPYLVTRGMTVEEASPLAENLHMLGGVVMEVVPRRRYPLGRDFCHLVGYVGRSDSEEAFEGEMTGRSGLELALDGMLAGQPGYRRQIVDAMGRVVSEFEGSGESPPVPGRDVTLTIDSGLQSIATDILARETAPGAAVVLDWRTGEILCMASSPGFDPQAFADGISSEEWNSVSGDPGNPMFPRAWSARYPPGSIFKLITAAYLLEGGLIDENSRPDPCYGSYRLGDRDFGCWTVHGRLSVTEAIAQSCDVFFYRTVQYGTVDGLAEYARGFGLGGTVLDGLPGESRGLVPDRLLLDSLYGPGGWGLGNLLNISIGQGELLVTPLQMAAMTGIFASSGQMPGLVLVRELPPGDAPWAGIALSPGTAETVCEGMYGAVHDRRGTLRVLETLPWTFYGKSGTAESAAGDHAWVVGFLREPRSIAIAVLVEHGGHGGAVAAPIVSQILTGWLGEGR